MSSYVLPRWPPGSPASPRIGMGQHSVDGLKRPTGRSSRIRAQVSNACATEDQTAVMLRASRGVSQLGRADCPPEHDPIPVGCPDVAEYSSAADDILNYSLLSCSNSSSSEDGLAGASSAIIQCSGNDVTEMLEGKSSSRENETGAEQHEGILKTHQVAPGDCESWVDGERGEIEVTTRAPEESTKTARTVRFLDQTTPENDSDGPTCRYHRSRKGNQSRKSDLQVSGSNVFSFQNTVQRSRGDPVTVDSLGYTKQSSRRTSVSLHSERADAVSGDEFISHRNGIHTSWRRVPASVAQVTERDMVEVRKAMSRQKQHVARVSLRRAGLTTPAASENASNLPNTGRLFLRRCTPVPHLDENVDHVPKVGAKSVACGPKGSCYSSWGGESLSVARQPLRTRSNEQHRVPNSSQDVSAKRVQVVRLAGSGSGVNETTRGDAKCEVSLLEGSRRKQSLHHTVRSCGGNSEKSLCRKLIPCDERSSPPRVVRLSSVAARKNLARAARASKIGTSADPVTLYHQRQESEARRRSAAGRRRKSHDFMDGRSSWRTQGVPILNSRSRGGDRLVWAGIR